MTQAVITVEDQEGYDVIIHSFKGEDQNRMIVGAGHLRERKHHRMASREAVNGAASGVIRQVSFNCSLEQ